LQHDFGDVAAGGVQADVDDPAFGAADAFRLGIFAQIGGVKAGVEMVGVGVGRFQRLQVLGREIETPGPGGHDGIGIELKRRRVADGVRPRPMMDEIDAAQGLAKGAEGVDIAVAGLAPVDELDAEFESGVGPPHELRLVQAETVIEILDLRQGGLADAYGTDLRRLDQDDVAAMIEHAGQSGRGHPARSSTARDYHALRLRHDVLP